MTQIFCFTQISLLPSSLFPSKALPGQFDVGG